MGRWRRRCTDIAGVRHVALEIEERSRMEPTALSAAMVATAEQLARELGVTHRRMPSGPRTTRWCSPAPACRR